MTAILHAEVVLTQSPFAAASNKIPQHVNASISCSEASDINHWALDPNLPPHLNYSMLILNRYMNMTYRAITCINMYPTIILHL